LWEFSEREGMGQSEGISTFFSTHPASKQRMEKLAALLPEVTQVFKISSPRCAKFREMEAFAKRVKGWSRHM